MFQFQDKKQKSTANKYHIGEDGKEKKKVWAWGGGYELQLTEYGTRKSFKHEKGFVQSRPGTQVILGLIILVYKSFIKICCLSLKVH